MRKKDVILLYGAGGLGVEVLDLLHRSGRWSNRMPLFIDDFSPTGSTLDIKKVSYEYALDKYFGSDLIVTVGDPHAREQILSRAKDGGFSLPTIVDSNARVSKHCEVGEGSVICAGSTIAARSKVSSNVLINVSSIVGHDVKIGRSSVLASMVNTGGFCEIGTEVMLGMSVTLRPGVKIGDNTVVALGSTVFSDIPSNVIVTGSPARVSRKILDKE